MVQLTQLFFWLVGFSNGREYQKIGIDVNKSKLPIQNLFSKWGETFSTPMKTKVNRQRFLQNKP